MKTPALLASALLLFMQQVVAQTVGLAVQMTRTNDQMVLDKRF